MEFNIGKYKMSFGAPKQISTPTESREFENPNPILDDDSYKNFYSNWWLKSFRTLIFTSIQQWRNAYSTALINLNRDPLQKTYTEISLDPSLQAAISFRVDDMMSSNYNILVNGEINDEYTTFFKSQWFYDVMKECEMSIFYGPTTFQITEFSKEEIQFQFLPRNGYIPEMHKYCKFPSSREGWDLESDDMEPWTFEYAPNKVEDLGIINGLCPYLLFKKQNNFAWSQLIEIYGVPPRIIKTANSNEDEKSRMFEALKNMGSSACMVADINDVFETMATGTYDYQMFKVFNDFINDEIQKEILGSTLLMENGTTGSFAQTDIHNINFHRKMQGDKRNFSHWVNHYFLPKLVNLGIIPDGLEFAFAEQEQAIDKDAVAAYTTLLPYFIFDVEKTAELFNLPIIAQRTYSSTQNNTNQNGIIQETSGPTE